MREIFLARLLAKSPPPPFTKGGLRNSKFLQLVSTMA
jgi:hypothetical protein